MSRVGFESKSQWPQIYVLDRAATGTVTNFIMVMK